MTNKERGLCSGMCPSSELEEHKFERNKFECDEKTGIFRPDYAIKKYARSASAKNMPLDITRPVTVLKKAMDHLIDVVAGKLGKKHKFLDLYTYVEDKLRSFQQDLTRQYHYEDGTDEEIMLTIDILEKSILFLVYSSVKLCSLDRFDANSNYERLTSMLTQLIALYDIHYANTGQHVPTEPEFRAIRLTTSLETSKFSQNLRDVDEQLLDAPAIRLVMRLKMASNSSNLFRYIEILNDAPPHIKCVALIGDNKSLWRRKIDEIIYSCKTLPLRANFFEDHLFIKSNILDIIKKRSFIIFGDDNRLSEYQNDDPPTNNHFPVIIPDKIQKSIDDMSCRDFFFLSQCPEPQLIPPPVSLLKTIDDNISDVSTETNECAIEYVENEPEIISVEAEKVESSDETQEIILPQPPTVELEPVTDIHSKGPELRETSEDNESKYLEYFRFDDLKKVPISKYTKPSKRTHSFVSALNIFNLLPDPKNLPPVSFAYVGVDVSDNSRTASFAISRLNFTGRLTYRKYELSGKVIFVTIEILQNEDYHENFGSILYCREDLPRFIAVPYQVFTMNTEFPFFEFDACLRKCIEAAVREAKLFSVSECFKKNTSKLINNSVFLYEQYRSKFTRKLLSNCFASNILPFYYNEITRGNLDKFIDSTRFIRTDTDFKLLKPLEIYVDSNFDIEFYFREYSNYDERPSFIDILSNFFN